MGLLLAAPRRRALRVALAWVPGDWSCRAHMQRCPWFAQQLRSALKAERQERRLQRAILGSEEFTHPTCGRLDMGEVWSRC